MVDFKFFFFDVLIANRKPAVIMVVGVNGGGKTTSLGNTSQKCQLSFAFI